MKAREAGVNVPTPIAFSNNVLVMELIGDEQVAPKLKDSHIEDPQAFFDETVDNIRKLYKAGLVHADLSPFNILNYHNKPVFIDFSQCSPINLSRTDEFLERDITNLINFFKKIGVKIDKDKIKAKILN